MGVKTPSHMMITVYDLAMNRLNRLIEFWCSFISEGVTMYMMYLEEVTFQQLKQYTDMLGVLEGFFFIFKPMFYYAKCSYL